MVGTLLTWVRWTVGRVGLVALVALVGVVTTVGVSANAPTVPTPLTPPPSTVPTEATYPRTHHAFQTDLTGKWRMSLNMEMGRATPLLELRQNEGKLTGTYTGRYGSSPVSGEVDGRTLKFSVGMETTTLQFRGEVKDDGTLAGTADFGDMGSVTWTAAREQ